MNANIHTHTVARLSGHCIRTDDSPFCHWKPLKLTTFRSRKCVFVCVSVYSRIWNSLKPTTWILDKHTRMCVKCWIVVEHSRIHLFLSLFLCVCVCVCETKLKAKSGNMSVSMCNGQIVDIPLDGRMCVRGSKANRIFKTNIYFPFYIGQNHCKLIGVYFCFLKWGEKTDICQENTGYFHRLFCYSGSYSKGNFHLLWIFLFTSLLPEGFSEMSTS